MNRLLVGIAVVGIAVVGIVGLVLFLPSALGFCDLIVVLAAAIEVGENVVEAVKEFLDADPASLVGDLPDNAQGAARAVIVATQAVVRVAGSLLGFVLPTGVLGALTDAVKGIATVCETLG